MTFQKAINGTPEGMKNIFDNFRTVKYYECKNKNGELTGRVFIELRIREEMEKEAEKITNEKNLQVFLENEKRNYLLTK